MSGPPSSTATEPPGEMPPEDSQPSLLSLESLVKTYGRGHGNNKWFRADEDASTTTVTAVDSISLSCAPGEIIGIAGPSGSGKSTLLHLLAGLESPTGGTIQFDGTDLSTLSDRRLTQHRLENVGIVFQRFHLLPSLSARANVALPLLEQGIEKSTRRERAATLLDQVGLSDRRRHTPDQLSGGEQQRVAIARALATDPPLIVADEPTGELDSTTSQTVLDVLKSIPANNERSVIIASHDTQTLSICDRVVELVDGQINRIYTPASSNAS